MGGSGWVVVVGSLESARNGGHFGAGLSVWLWLWRRWWLWLWLGTEKEVLIYSFFCYF
jgi:hypothetical protein